MKMLGNSRGVAATLAVAMGFAVAPAFAQAPAAPPPAGTPAKPAAPAAKPAAPAAPAAAPAKPATPAAPKPATPAAPKPAGAPVKKVDDKALVTSGQKKLDGGDHAGALADFEAAYAAKATAEAQRGIALAHDKLGHFPEAARAYQQFIADAPNATAKQKDQSEEAKKRLQEITSMPGKLHVESVPPGATVTVDPPADAPATAAASGTTPAAASGTTTASAPLKTPTDLELAPGQHKLHFVAEGFEDADKDVVVAYASKQDVKAELVAKPPPPPPPPVVAEQPAPPPPAPPPPVEERSKVPAIVTGAVALVAAGVGTGFGLRALSQSNDYEKTPTTKLADDGENNALIADMMFGVAITFGVTSAVLFLSSDAPQQAAKGRGFVTAKVLPPAAPKRGVTIMPAPYVTPTGGGAGAVVKF